MNARLNFCRKAEELAPRMFQLHDHRPREVVSMFGLIMSESATTREDAATVFDAQTRVPCPILFPQITPEIPKPNSAPPRTVSPCLGILATSR